jgi:hypothetical protein
MLGAWNSYYVLTGSASAALTGLMFVVITLVTDAKQTPSRDGLSTFSTPTVVHFSYALFVSAIMAVPFRSLLPIAVILGLAGICGLVYIARIALRTLKLETYTADIEDWSCNVLLPLCAYALLVIAAIAIHIAPAAALYGPAAATLILIFVGIHNAWDVVTFLATGQADQVPDEPAQRSDSTSSKS